MFYKHFVCLFFTIRCTAKIKKKNVINWGLESVAIVGSAPTCPYGYVCARSFTSHKCTALMTMIIISLFTTCRFQPFYFLFLLFHTISPTERVRHFTFTRAPGRPNAMFRYRHTGIREPHASRVNQM